MKCLISFSRITMKPFLSIFFFLLTFQFTFAQIEISGVVITKKRGREVPLQGASALIEGTTIGMFTNENGEFVLTVPDENTEIIVSYVGYRTQSAKVGNQKSLKFILERSCIRCFFYDRYLEINYYGGLKQAPVGLLLDLQLPYIIRPAIRLRTGFQTNFRNNQQLQLELGLTELFYNCDLVGSLWLKHNQIKIPQSNFHFQSTFVEGNVILRTFFRQSSVFYFGLGRGRKMNDLAWEPNYGYELGLGQGLPFRLYAFGKVTYWKDFWQFQGGLRRGFGDFEFGFLYNKIDNYEEFNLTLGYRFVFNKKLEESN